MPMDNQIEDINLKGMMAFSAKEYQKAYACWRKVLEMNPDHEEAKKGILKLKQMKKRKTPKEVLRDIKQHYSDGNYERALKLCNMLVQRFPDNTDLQGLKKKIENRLKKETLKAQGLSAEQVSVETMESTMYFQQKAEETNWEDTEHEGEDAPVPESGHDDEILRLIQQGVTLYEIQDLEGAVTVWERALELDPGNKIVLDYIQGVRNQTSSSAPETPAEPVSSPPVHQENPPDKEQLVAIYNEGKDFYREKKYQEALEKWRFILNFYPGHKETLLCVERAEKGIQEEDEYLKILEDAETAYSAGNYTEAERLILPIVIKAPHLEGPKNLKEAIERRKTQITEIRNLELESQTMEATAEASDDEITQYFTPAAQPSISASSTATPKMVISATEIMAAEKSTRTNLLRGLSLVAVLLVAFGGFFIWKNWSDMRAKIIADAPVKVTIPRIIKWNSNEARVNDYLEMANEYKSLGDYFMAYCAYDKVIQLSDLAISELVETKSSMDVVNKIRAAKATSEQEREKAKKKIVPEEPDKTAFEKVLKGWSPDEADNVIPVLRAALTQDIDDIELRDYYAKAEGQIGFRHAKDVSQLENALNAFKKAAILGPKGNRYRSHYKVIQLFYTNTIDDHERKQWFFLFSGI